MTAFGTGKIGLPRSCGCPCEYATYEEIKSADAHLHPPCKFFHRGHECAPEQPGLPLPEDRDDEVA